MSLILGDDMQDPTSDAASRANSYDDETEEDFKQRLIYILKQMMFVSGETAEPGPETTWMIEEIVRDQVTEMVCPSQRLRLLVQRLTHANQLSRATMLANRRGSRSITIGDLIFQIRHDRAKVSRLKTFLSWKDVRKNVKDSDDKGGGDAGDVGDFEEVKACPSSPSPSQSPSGC
jgi:transcription initiation protein SPT3